MWKSAERSVYVMKYLTIFKPLIYISFSLSDTMSLMKRWETQPGKPSAWVTWRPSDQLKNLTGMVWTHINFIRTFQVTLLAGITWRGRGRRKTSERLSDTLRLLVASRQWHSLHGGIFLENFQKGGGGGWCTAPPDTDQKCYFSHQFSDLVLESFTWSTTLFLVLLSLHR